MMLSIAVLEAEGNGLAGLLARRADVTIESASSIEDLTTLVTGGTVDAILVDPDFAEGWPASNAVEVTERLASALPLVLACRSAHDRGAIKRATDGRAVVLSRDVLDRESLMTILAGEVAKRRVRDANS